MHFLHALPSRLVGSLYLPWFILTLPVPHAGSVAPFLPQVLSSLVRFGPYCLSTAHRACPFHSTILPHSRALPLPSPFPLFVPLLLLLAFNGRAVPVVNTFTTHLPASPLLGCHFFPAWLLPPPRRHPSTPPPLVHRIGLYAFRIWFIQHRTAHRWRCRDVDGTVAAPHATHSIYTRVRLRGSRLLVTGAVVYACVLPPRSTLLPFAVPFLPHLPAARYVAPHSNLPRCTFFQRQRRWPAFAGRCFWHVTHPVQHALSPLTLF